MSGQALHGLSCPIPANTNGLLCRLRPACSPGRKHSCKSPFLRPQFLCGPVAGLKAQGVPSARRARPSRSSLSSNSLTSSSCAARPTSARARSRSARASSRLRSVARSWCSNSVLRVSRSCRVTTGRFGGPQMPRVISLAWGIQHLSAIPTDPTLGQISISWLPPCHQDSLVPQ